MSNKKFVIEVSCPTRIREAFRKKTIKNFKYGDRSEFDAWDGVGKVYAIIDGINVSLTLNISKATRYGSLEWAIKCSHYVRVCDGLSRLISPVRIIEVEEFIKPLGYAKVIKFKQ